MTTPRFGFARTLPTLALVAGVALSALLSGNAVDAKHKHHPPKPPKPPVVQDDVIVKSIKTGPDGGGPNTTHRTVLVEVRNDGDQTVGPFVVELSADRDGASRPAQASAQVMLGPNESQTVQFLAIGCKWLNIANHATLTAVTNPNPVAGEDGPSSNNTLTVAPNLDFSGQMGCTGV